METKTEEDNDRWRQRQRESITEGDNDRGRQRQRETKIEGDKDQGRKIHRMIDKGRHINSEKNTVRETHGASQ